MRESGFVFDKSVVMLSAGAHESEKADASPEVQGGRRRAL